MRSRLLAFTLLAAWPLPAQSSVIVPAAFRTRMDLTSGSTWLAGSIQRFQQVFDAREMPSRLDIGAIAFRQPRYVFGGGFAADGPTVELEIKLGYTTRTPTSLRPDYTSNWDQGTPITVLPRQKLELPDLEERTQLDPSFFLVQIPLRNRFAWQRQSGRNLLMEFRIFSSSVDFRSGCIRCTDYSVDVASRTNTGYVGTWGVETRVLPGYGLVTSFRSTPLAIARYDDFGSSCPGTTQIATTLPPEALTGLGKSGDAVLTGPATSQSVYAGSSLQPGRIQALHLRFSQVVDTTTSGIESLSLSMGYTGRTPASLSKDAASNIDSGPLTSVFVGSIAVPANRPSSDPSRWDLRIPFTRPWTYLPRTRKNLLIQFQNQLQSGTRRPWFDAFEFSPTSAGIRDTGTIFKLKRNGGLAVRLEGLRGPAAPVLLTRQRPILGTTMLLEIGGARPIAPALLWVGVSRTAWGPFRLPLAMPGGCTLYASIDTALPAVTDPAGRAAIPLAIPRLPALSGSRFFVQAAIVDPANALQLVTTNAGAAWIGAR